MLYSKIPCPPGVRARSKRTITPGKIQENIPRRTSRKRESTTCIREGNRAVPALRMYKNCEKMKEKFTHFSPRKSSLKKAEGNGIIREWEIDFYGSI